MGYFKRNGLGLARPEARAFLILSALLSVLLLSGCVADPNANLQSGACCMKNPDPHFYTCSVASAKPDNNGLSALAGCGACQYIGIDGTLYHGDTYPTDNDKSKLTPLTLADCENNCNFQPANCTGEDNQSTCYGFGKDPATGQYTDVYDKSIRVAPICADSTPDPCVQNNCTALICGQRAPSQKIVVGSTGLTALTQKDAQGNGKTNTFADQGFNNPPSGLVGKVCVFTPYDQQTSRLLKTGKWSVNSFRLGVQGSFSDYDRARYYFPPNDFFCASPGSAAVVDRFTSYINTTYSNPPLKCTDESELDPPNYLYRYVCSGDGQAFEDTCNENLGALPPESCPDPPDQKQVLQERCDQHCANAGFKDTTKFTDQPHLPDVFQTPGTEFKTPTSYCTIDPASDPFSFYCARSPDLTFKFSPIDPSSKDLAFEACKKACNFAQLQACQDNSRLLTKEVAISPPGTAQNQIVKQPFIDRSAYARLFSTLYPDRGGVSQQGDPTDPRDYYRPAEDLSSMTPGQIVDYASTPGAPGAMAFECASDSDCLSGQCSFSLYSRSTCFSSSGESRSCSCKTIQGCDSTYLCDQYSPDSVEMAVCKANVKWCQNAGGDSKPIVVCSYDSTDATPAVQSGGYTTRGTNKDLMDRLGYAPPSGGSNWGVLDFSEFNKYLDKANPTWSYDNIIDGMRGKGQNIELANNQKKVLLADQCVKDGQIGPAVYSCPADHPESYNSKCCVAGAADCIDQNNGNVAACCVAAVKSCPSGYTLQDVSMWRNITSAYGTGTNPDNDYLRWHWTESYSAVPTWQPLVKNGIIFTDPLTDILGLKDKFPIIGECHMKVAAWNDPPATIAAADVVELRPDIANADSISPDPNAREDKSWKIQSFGDCAPSGPNGGTLKIQSFGVCEPCGSVLSMAYQNVSDWKGRTYASWQTDKASDPTVASGYCPSTCTPFTSYDGKDATCRECPKSYPKSSFSLMAEGSVATDPSYSFLASKIDEYQSSSIMPVLDLRGYGRVFNFGFGAPDGASNRVIPMSNYNYGSDSYINDLCHSYGGTLGNKQCDNRLIGFCTGWKYDCTIPPEADWLLGFLAKNHSAAIAVLDNLPDNCAANPQDPDCALAKARLINARAICPDCLLGIEYQKSLYADSTSPLDCSGASAPARSAEKEYNQTLRGAILSWSEGMAPFDPYSFKPNGALATMPAMKNVDVLVLNIDISRTLPPNADLNDPATAALLEASLNQSINLSRHVLQQASWPTLWKLTYDEGCDPSNPGLYSNPQFFERLYAHARELSLAGVVGVLLPPLDGGKSPQAVSSADSFLLPAGASVSDTSTPFCAASGASAQFSHPTISAGIRKVVARDFGPSTCAGPGTGACMPCSQVEIDLGICNPVCLDGSSCTPGQKCAPNCLSVQYCQQNLCKDSTRTITCTAARSDNKAPVPCTPGQDLATCDVATMPMSALANDILLPQAPQLIGGLPPGQVCCLQSPPSPPDSPNPQPASYYAYTSRASVNYAPEPDIFPKGGATTTDCGRNPPVDSDSTVLACGGTKPTPPPIGSTYWSCVQSA